MWIIFMRVACFWIALARTFNFEKRNLIFPRYGNWLVGYVVLRGYLEETEAVKK
jgi:hypothetical protein